MSLMRSALVLAALVGSTALVTAENNWTGMSGPDRAPASPQPAGRPAADAVFSLGEAPARPALRRSAAVESPLSAAAPGLRAPASVPAPVVVDENALRYYASQKDMARVAAEIRRIKALHPSWQPPQDLFSAVQDNGEERRLWELFAKNDLQGIRDAIEEIQAEQPNWRPSEDFVTKFERAEIRRDLVAASDTGDNSRVIALAQANPALMSCAEIDVMWRVGEALARTQATDKAFDLYRFILARCPVAAERVATVQKAALLLPAAKVEQLVAMGQRRLDGTGEFDQVRADLFRKRVGDLAANPAGAAPIDAAELKAFEDATTARRNSKDGELIGWYRYSREEWAEAARWFKDAMTWTRNPKAVEGYALALRQQGKAQEAEAIAYEWQSADPLIAKLYIEIVAKQLTEPGVREIDAERLGRFGKSVDEAKSAHGAQALGWYYYNHGDTKAARDWFERSLAMGPSETNVLGLTLAANKLKDKGLVKRLVAEYGKTYPAIVGIEKWSRVAAVQPRKGGRAGKGGGTSASGNLAQQAVDLYKAGRYDDALETLNRRKGSAKEDEGLQIIRGWTLFHLGRYDKAREHFAEMNRRRPTRDTQYGYHYANERLIPKVFSDHP